MQVKKMKIIFAFLCLQACGKSIYAPLSKNDSTEAKQEDLLIALDKGDYDKALTLSEWLWNKKKSNETAQYYAVSLVGFAGFDLFSLIRNAFKKASETSSTASSSGTSKSQSGDNIMSKISEVLPTTISEESMIHVKEAIGILATAPDQKAKGLFFQKCITGAIYALPTLDRLQTSLTHMQTFLASLPVKVGSSGPGGSCSASASTVDAVGVELETLISDASATSEKIQEIVSLVGDCLGDNAKSVGETSNEVQAKIAKLVQTADKGCTVSTSVGGLPLPACMTSFVTNSAGSAFAGDSKVAGCEVFLNCAAGGCF